MSTEIIHRPNEQEITCRFSENIERLIPEHATNEERRILETYAASLRKRLATLEEMVHGASFRFCGHDKTLEAFWIAGVPNFISERNPLATEAEPAVIYWGDAKFPTTNPNEVSYDCIVVYCKGRGFWSVGGTMYHRRYPKASDRKTDCPYCGIPWWVGAGWMEPFVPYYIEGWLGVALEELNHHFRNYIHNTIYPNKQGIFKKACLLPWATKSVLANGTKVLTRKVLELTK